MSDQNNQQNKQNQNQGIETTPTTVAAQEVEVVEDTPEQVTKRREAEQAKIAADQAANQGQSGEVTTSKTTVVKQTKPNENK